ncbi:hypothetical protein BGZ76_009535 [Entomortierella beljakovae]|nr:hypothetical protein BGZ76_009535 [Entomortierella beljakovae]
MDNGDIPNGHLTNLDAGIFIYAVLIVSLIVATVYFARIFMAHRRHRQRALKDPDFEAGPPMYCYHVNDLPVDDASTTQGIIAHTTYPAAALVRGEDYYIVTPRVRIYSNSSSPYSSHSRSGSNSSRTSSNNSNNNNTVDLQDSPPAPYTSTDRLPMTQVGVRPPPYEVLSSGTRRDIQVSLPSTTLSSSCQSA